MDGWRRMAVPIREREKGRTGTGKSARGRAGGPPFLSHLCRLAAVQTDGVGAVLAGLQGETQKQRQIKHHYASIEATTEQRGGHGKECEQSEVGKPVNNTARRTGPDQSDGGRLAGLEAVAVETARARAVLAVGRELVLRLLRERGAARCRCRRRGRGGGRGGRRGRSCGRSCERSPAFAFITRAADEIEHVAVLDAQRADRGGGSTLCSFVSRFMDVKETRVQQPRQG